MMSDFLIEAGQIINYSLIIKELTRYSNSGINYTIIKDKVILFPVNLFDLNAWDGRRYVYEPISPQMSADARSCPQMPAPAVTSPSAGAIAYYIYYI